MRQSESSIAQSLKINFLQFYCQVTWKRAIENDWLIQKRAKNIYSKEEVNRLKCFLFPVHRNKLWALEGCVYHLFLFHAIDDKFSWRVVCDNLISTDAINWTILLFFFSLSFFSSLWQESWLNGGDRSYEGNYNQRIFLFRISTTAGDCSSVTLYMWLQLLYYLIHSLGPYIGTFCWIHKCLQSYSIQGMHFCMIGNFSFASSFLSNTRDKTNFLWLFFCFSIRKVAVHYCSYRCRKTFLYCIRGQSRMLTLAHVATSL